MAYDAEIRVGTKVDSSQMQKLQLQINKTTDKAAQLSEELNEIKNKKIPTEEYEKLQKEISGAEKELKKMAGQTEKLATLESRIKKLSASAGELADKMNAPEIRVPTKEYESLAHSMDTARFTLNGLIKEQEKLGDGGIGKGSDEEYLAAYESVKRLKAELQQAVSEGNQEDYLVIEDRLNRAKAILQEMMAKEPRPLGDISYYYSIENRIKDLKNDLSAMESEANRLSESGKAFTVDTDNAEYKKLASEYEAVNQELGKAKVLHGEIVQKQEDARNKAETLKAQMEQLVKEGKAFTLGEDTEEYAKKSRELSYLQADLRALNKRQEELIEKESRSADGFGRMNAAAKKAFAAMSGGLEHVKKGLGKVGNVAKGVFQKLHKGAERSNGQFSALNASVKRFVVNILLLGQAAKAFRALVSGAGEGIQEFARYSKDCNAVLSDLKASLQTMKYSLGAAFAPIIQTVVPYLTQLINVLNAAISKLAEFFAAVTGRSTFYRAVSQQADFAGSLEDTAEAAKKAAGALAGFDRLNVINQEDSDSSGGGGTGAGFEEVPVENDIKRLADKVKEILSSLFAPMKEAWDREGQFVIDSWKSALKEIWALAKDMGRDLLIVWNQEETIQMFADILHIIGDIGLVAGNLARNFREAWNENNTGLHIFENIRDILAVIIANIRKAADYTVEWSEDLNFKPLLTSFEGFTASLVPVMDNLSGVLTDFYTKVLLPLGKWTLEKGIPELLDVFTAFNEKVDWESLRENLAELWEHLEPFAETVGEGLILFIERVSDLVADFLNSETFVDFLHAIEDWMDSVEPEDVADAIEKLAKALIGLKAAVVILDAALKVSRIVTGLGRIVRSLLKFKEYVGKAVLFLKNINWASLFSTINPGMIGEMGLTLERMLQGTFLDTSTWEGLPKKVNDAINGAIDAVMQGLGEAFVNIFDFTQTLELFEAVGYWFEELKKDFAERDWKSIGIDILNAIGSGILGALSFVTEPIQNIFKMIQDEFSKIAQWINELLGGMNKVRSAGAGLAGIGAGAVQNIVGKSNVMQRNINIPQLATGSVIRGGNPFFAILGEQPVGQTNVEAPLSTIKQALKEGMRESGMTGGGTMELNVYLTGKQIYHEIVKQDQIVKKSTGRSGFAK